jgi:hypothetical protein
VNVDGSSTAAYYPKVHTVSGLNIREFFRVNLPIQRNQRKTRLLNPLTAPRKHLDPLGAYALCLTDKEWHKLGGSGFKELPSSRLSLCRFFFLRSVPSEHMSSPDMHSSCLSNFSFYVLTLESTLASSPQTSIFIWIQHGKRWKYLDGCWTGDPQTVSSMKSTCVKTWTLRPW